MVSAYNLVVSALTYSSTAPPADLGSVFDPGSFADPSPPNNFLSIFTVLSCKNTKRPKNKCLIGTDHSLQYFQSSLTKQYYSKI